MKEPSSDQLMMLATSAAVPFIGFGFMDNAIMIVAGEVRLIHLDACAGLWLPRLGKQP